MESKESLSPAVAERTTDSPNIAVNDDVGAEVNEDECDADENIPEAQGLGGPDDENEVEDYGHHWDENDGSESGGDDGEQDSSDENLGAKDGEDPEDPDADND